MAKYDEEILEALGKGNIPAGPWTSTPANFPDEYGLTVRAVDDSPVVVDDCISEETAAYIAACSPANIVPLIAELRFLRKESEERRLRDAGLDVESMRKTASQIAMAEAGKVTWFAALEALFGRMGVEIEELRAAIHAAMPPKVE